MSEEKGNSKLVKIGGALIILAACGIMLPAIFQFVAGVGRMVILIVVALGLAYLLNMMMARQAIEKVRKAKATAASASGTNETSATSGETNGDSGTGAEDMADKN